MKDIRIIDKGIFMLNNIGMSKEDIEKTWDKIRGGHNFMLQVKERYCSVEYLDEIFSDNTEG